MSELLLHEHKKEQFEVEFLQQKLKNLVGDNEEVCVHGWRARLGNRGNHVVPQVEHYVRLRRHLPQFYSSIFRIQQWSKTRATTRRKAALAMGDDKLLDNTAGSQVIIVRNNRQQW